MSIVSTQAAGASQRLASGTINLSQHKPEHNWQYLLERSIANRTDSTSCLCLHQSAALRLLLLQSLVHSGQNLLVAGSLPANWESYVKEHLYPRGISVKHSYTNEPESWEQRLNEDTRLLYWFTPGKQQQSDTALQTLYRLSRHYRIPLLIDSSAHPGAQPTQVAHQACLQLGSLPGCSVAWLTESSDFSWNSGNFPQIMQGDSERQDTPLISYLRRHWCALLGLGLHDQTAADAWQRLLADQAYQPQTSTAL